MGGWEGDETRCEEGEKERRKLTQLTVVAEAAAVLSLCLRRSAQRRNRGGEDVARQNAKREICEKKESKLEGEVEEEILVLLAQALLNGSFELEREAAVADCCCLAVCCSDMQDCTMCSQRERGGETE